MNQHHGMQSSERFGIGTDPDGDGITNELSRAEMTGLSLYQAALPVPGQVIPNDPEIEKAIQRGEVVFGNIGCARCHIPALPLSKRGWIYEEPGPYNPSTNLRTGEAPAVRLDLTSKALPQPRLTPVLENGDLLVWVPVFTDFKLHDITSGPDDPNVEPLDMNFGPWSVKFGRGNRRFLTRRLWGCGNQPPYFHHGRFTTMRAAVLAHAGEALDSRKSFERLPDYDRDALIEFLKSLQVLPPGTSNLVVDENLRPKRVDGNHQTPLH